MAIRGDLLSVDLSNVFQMLAMNRKRGVLYLQNRENILEKRALMLDSDRVGLLDLPASQDLAAILVDQGELSYDEYADAVAKSAQFQVEPVSYLSKRGIITQEQIEAARTRLQEELILEIFLWKNVSFHLDEEKWPEENRDRRYFVLDLTVMEAARRQDEWARVTSIIGATKDIWAQSVADPQAAAETLDPVERIVFNHIDNVRGSQEITDATGLPRYHVELALSNLSEAGSVRKLELDDLIEVGDELVRAGKHDDGIRLFKCAVRHNRHSIALHKRLAQAYLRENRVAKAAAHYKYCAITLVDKGLLREALAIYQYVLSILPTDFRSLQQGVAILAQMDEALTSDDERTFDLALKLAHFYFEQGRYKNAKQVLDDLLAISPEDIGLSYLEARILAKSGQVNEAIETYMRLASRMHAQGDLEGALGAYKLVVSFDSVTKDICQGKMADIRRQLSKRQRRKVAGLAFFLTCLVVVGSGIAYLYYHNTAEAAFDQAREAESDAVSGEGWSAQAQRYAAIESGFPLTFAAKEAGVLRKRAEGNVQRARLQVQAVASKKREDGRTSLKMAENHMDVARSHLIVGDFKRALVSYHKAVAELASSSQQAWGDLPPRNLSARIKEIEDYLAREKKSLSTIEELLRQGENRRAYDEARKNFFPKSQDNLSAQSVVVVSAEAMAALRVPFEVRSAPADAKYSDGAGHDSRGVARPILTADSPTIDLDISRPGFRSQRRMIHWAKSAFRTDAILEKLPAERREIGDRVVDVKLRGPEVIYLAGNGVIYRSSTLGAPPRRLAPKSFVTPSTPLVVTDKGSAYATTEGQVFFLSKNPRVMPHWKTRVSLDSIRGMVEMNGTFVVVTHDGEPKILFLDARGKKISERIQLDSPIVHLRKLGGLLYAVDEAGSLLRIDAEAKQIRGKKAGNFVGVPCLAGSSLLIRDRRNQLEKVSLDLLRSEPLDQSLRFVGDPVESGGYVLCTLREGGVLELDQQLRKRVLGKGWRKVLSNTTGRIFPLSNRKFLVEMKDASQILIDGSTDTLRYALRPETGSRSIPFSYSGRIILACRDVHGAIEIYRD